MVTRVRNESGKGRLGCLVWLLIAAAVGYYGYGIGGHYIDYYRMLDEMQTQAEFAPSLEDGVIKRRLVSKAEALDLPEDAKRITIRRLSSPREIVISASWQVVLEVPFYTRTVTFHPVARAPL